MKLPFTIRLAGQTITVEADEDLDFRNINGESHCDRNVITLSPNYKGKPQSDEAMQQTFYHELTHMILNKLGQHELSNDEALVQSFSLLLHQALNSKNS